MELPGLEPRTKTYGLYKLAMFHHCHQGKEQLYVPTPYSLFFKAVLVSCVCGHIHHILVYFHMLNALNLFF